MWNLLYTLIILTSIFFLPIKDAFGMPKQAVFIIVGFIMVAVSLMNTDTKTLTFKNKWIGLTFIYVILSSFAYYFFLPILTNTSRYIGFSMNANLATLTIILSILIVQCLVEWTDDLQRWVKVGKLLCWVGLGFSCYAIIQYIGLDQIFHSNLRWLDNASPQNIDSKMHFVNYRMITFLGNRRETACFLTMLSPMCLMFEGLRYKIIYGIMFLVVLLTLSGVAIISFILGFILYLLLSGKWKWSIVGLLSLITSGIVTFKFHPNFFAFYGKLQLWKDIFLNTKFLAGDGIGSFPLLRYKVGDALVINAECTILQLLSDGGIILVILIAGYVITLYRRVLLEYLSSNSMLLIGYIVGLTTFIILSFGSSPLHYPALLLIGIVYVSSLEAQTNGG